MRCAEIAPLAVVCLLTACQNGDEVIAPALCTAAPIADGVVEVEISGRIADRHPAPHRPVMPWIPLLSFRPEGEQVEAGDELFALDADMARSWSAERDTDIAVAEAEKALKRVDAVRELEDLRAERVDLEHRARILRERIAATLRHDAESLRIAEIEYARAQRALERSALRLERLERLDAAGAARRRELTAARRARERAAAGLELPAVRLNVQRTSTGALSRRLLEIERAIVELKLGEDGTGSGAFGDIATGARRLELERLILTRNLRKWYAARTRDRKAIEDSVVRASTGGVLSYRGRDVHLGYRARKTALAFVLKPEEMGCELLLPQRWRGLVRSGSDERGTPIRVTIPALRRRDLSGRILSVASGVEETRARGLHAYRCQAVFAETVAGLREGMAVTCRVQVAVPAGVCRLPIWCVVDSLDPVVVLADGSRRSVTGRAYGDVFVVTGGLAPGTAVRQRPGLVPAERQRLTGTVMPTGRIPLRVPFHGVELIDMVADGSAVAAGDTVATLASTSGRAEDPLAEVDRREAVARNRFDIARLAADAERNTARVSWREAELELDHRRLDLLAERLVVDEERQVSGRVALRQAELARDAAREDLERTRLAWNAGTASAHALLAAESKLALTGIALRRSGLQAAEDHRSRDWLGIWNKQEALHQAEAAAHASRLAWGRQRMAAGLAERRAADALDGELRECARIRRRQAGLVMKAPITGRVFHATDDRGRPIRIGGRLRTPIPFFMPDGPARQLRLEVPVHLFGRYRAGMPVTVHVPALGADPLIGTVARVFPYFHTGAAARGGQLPADRVATPRRVFTVVIDLPVDAAIARQLPPGVTAWTELEP